MQVDFLCPLYKKYHFYAEKFFRLINVPLSSVMPDGRDVAKKDSVWNFYRRIIATVSRDNQALFRDNI